MLPLRFSLSLYEEEVIVHAGSRVTTNSTSLTEAWPDYLKLPTHNLFLL